MQHTHSPDNLPEIGKTIADQAKREGVAERLHDAAVQQTIAVDRALISDDANRLQDLELSLLQTAKHHEAHPLSLLHTIPGIGNILSLVWRYEMHQIDRFPSGQDVASSGRLVKCRKASGGKRLGTAGKKIGHAHLKWAVSAAAALFRRNHPQGQKLLRRLETKPDTGKALSLLAHTLGRAVYDMLKHPTACAMDRFLRSGGSRADEPGASLDASGDEPASSTLDV